jgi:hypothetical protein
LIWVLAIRGKGEARDLGLEGIYRGMGRVESTGVMQAPRPYGGCLAAARRTTESTGEHGEKRVNQPIAGVSAVRQGSAPTVAFLGELTYT